MVLVAAQLVSLGGKSQEPLSECIHELAWFSKRAISLACQL